VYARASTNLNVGGGLCNHNMDKEFSDIKINDKGRASTASFIFVLVSYVGRLEISQ
jgi:hypothetical protein